MKCDKCGNEVDENNKFCTNCGSKLKIKRETTDKNILYIKFNHLMIAIFIIIIIITLIVFFILTNKKEKKSINQDINTITTEVQETKKNQVEIGKDYSYVIEDETGSIRFNTETDFIMRTGISYSEGIIETGTYIISGNIIKLTINYNSNNDYGDKEENPNYVAVPYNIEMTILDDGNIEHKTEYGTYLYIKEGSANTNNNDNSLLEQIYSKYPDLKSKEGYICTDGEQYWILDNAGEKIYFTDMESFESALVKSYTSETNTNVEQSEVNSITDNSSNKNNNSNNNIQSDKGYIDIPKLAGLTEQQAISKVKELNIPYKISYQEDINKKEGIVLDQSYHDEVIRNYKGEIVAAYSQSRLYPGETLYIFVNKIKERTMILDIHRSCLIEKYVLSKKGLYVGVVDKIDSPLDLVVKANGKTIFNDKLTNEDLNINLYQCTTSEVKYTGKKPPKIEIVVNGEVFATYTAEEMSSRFYDDTANEKGEKWYIGFTEHGAG